MNRVVGPLGRGSRAARRPALAETCLGRCLLPGIELGGETASNESASRASASHGVAPSPNLTFGS